MASKTSKLWGNIAKIGLPIVGAYFGGPVGAAVGGAVGGAVSGKGGLKNAAVNSLVSYGGSKLLGKLFPGSSTTNQAPNASIAGLPGGSLPPPTNPPPTTGQGSGNGWFSNLFGKPNKMTTAGITSLLAGQLIPNPSVPELPASFEEYRNMAKSGGTEISKLGTNRLSELLNTDMTAATDDELNAATQDLELQKSKEIESVKDLYRNLRPGTDPSTDSAYRRDLAEVEDRYNKAIVNTRSTLRRDITSQNNSQRLQQIIASSNLNSQQLDQLLQVANWDTMKIMTEFNIDYNSASQLKDFLMAQGEGMLNQGIGLGQVI